MWDGLLKLPGVFALCVAGLTFISGTLGAVIAYFIVRKVDAKTQAAHKRLTDTLEEIIKRETAEKHDYRIRLHESRDQAHELGLKLKDAESRPDLSRLFEAQQKEADRRYEVYTQQTTLIAEQTKALGGIATLQEKLIADFENHEEQNSKMQGMITQLLEELVNGKRRRPTKHEVSE